MSRNSVIALILLLFVGLPTAFGKRTRTLSGAIDSIKDASEQPIAASSYPALGARKLLEEVSPPPILPSLQVPSSTLRFCSHRRYPGAGVQ